MHDLSVLVAGETLRSPVSSAALPARSSPLTAVAIRQAIESWSDLNPAQRRALVTAMNHVEHIIADGRALLIGYDAWSCAGLNRVLWARPAGAYGLSSKAFRDMLSGLRTTLIRLGVHAESGHGRNELNPAWAALYEALPTDERRKGLIRFFRFLTLSGVTPETLTSESINEFDLWCRTEILHEDPCGLSRRSAGNWEFARQNVPGWPQLVLSRAGMRDHYALPFDSFPPSFAASVENFLGRLAAGPGDRFKAGNPFRPLADRAKAAALAPQGLAPTPKAGGSAPSPRGFARALAPRTIETRRWQIRVAATALVESGVPAEAITGLADLVTPIERPVAILHFHRERLRRALQDKGEDVEDEDLRSSSLKGIGEMLRQVAKFEAQLTPAELEELQAFNAMVSPAPQITMSEKNRTRLQALLDDRVTLKLLHLPAKWMKAAATDTRLTPMEAARLAMFATALEIMLVVPLRRDNVVHLRLDTNLRRQGPQAPVSEIFVPRRAVKNRKPIIWPIEAETARLIEAYLKKYRPLLAKPDNPYLFPGISESARNDAQFGKDFSTEVETVIGAEFNCHLVRHYAVVRYLRQNPGAYEVAAHILGHKNPETTRRFYCGLELDAAARHANALLTGERKATKILALGAYHKPHRARRVQGGAP